MPKYVAKEDVENNLVDPNKPLEEQPEYKKKVEEEAEKRHKQHQEAKPNYRQKKERPPRNKRPVFNWNKKEVMTSSDFPELN